MRKSRQLEMRLADPRGGKRAGAGRKRAPGKKSCVRHVKRDVVKPRWPVHVTIRLRDDAPRMRRFALVKILRGVFFAAKKKPGFRLCQFSIQSNHVHLVCEAENAVQLSRGVQGFEVRLARALNWASDRSGKVLADRYHARNLKTPREVKNALHYVLQNAFHHGTVPAGWGGTDPFSSAWWFDGWRDDTWRTRCNPPTHEPTVATPCSYLLRVGWRRHGLLVPAGETS